MLVWVWACFGGATEVECNHGFVFSLTRLCCVACLRRWPSSPLSGCRSSETDVAFYLLPICFVFFWLVWGGGSI